MMKMRTSMSTGDLERPAGRPIRGAYPSYHAAPGPSPILHQQTERSTRASMYNTRMGLHQSMTGLGPVFHHVGSFTPLDELKMPKDARAGHVGPWRSYGAWWASLQKEEEKARNILHEDQLGSRYWPLGKEVQKVHGSFQPEHYYMGYRPRNSADPPSGQMSQNSNSLWIVKNSYVEKVRDAPARRSVK